MPRRPGAHARDLWQLARRHALAPLAEATSSERACIDEAPDGWIFDVAWDGHRVLACKFGRDVCVLGYERRDLAHLFPRVAAALSTLAAPALVVEGFVCLLDAAGRPSFELLVKDAARTPSRVVLAVTDLLREGDDDLTARPTHERRARLAALLEGAPPGLVHSEPMPGPLGALLAGARSLGAPGILARSRSGDAKEPVVAVSASEGPIALDRPVSPPPAVTNAKKVLYPRDGLTKTDIARYYDDVAPTLLAHLAGRVVVAQRWPDGIDEFTWYQHRIPPRAPDYLKGAWIDGDRRIRVDSRDALLWLVNQAALTFHTWASRVASLEQPDWVMLDLDPGESTRWEHTIAVALTVRKVLETLELPSVVKTSGQKGIHVLVPIGPGHRVDQAHDAARGIAALVARLHPDLATLESDKEKRKGRLFLDHLQSYVGRSLVAPYSLRAADGAPVSTPLDWSEVSAALDPRATNLRTLRARLDARGDLAAPLLSGTTRLEPALSALAALAPSRG